MHYKAFSIIKFGKRDHNEPLYLTLHMHALRCDTTGMNIYRHNPFNFYKDDNMKRFPVASNKAHFSSQTKSLHYSSIRALPLA